MTQPTSRAANSLTISRTVAASRERVFSAWTDPVHLRQWWAAAEGFTTPIAEVDLRVGGAYRLGMQAPGEPDPYLVGGTYLEVEPPERLVYTWAWKKKPSDDPDWMPPVTLVTVEFHDRGESTEIVLTHEEFSDEHMRNEHSQGWNGCLDSLTRYLRNI